MGATRARDPSSPDGQAPRPRRPLRRLRPWLVPAPLAAVALAVGGVPGLLLGFVAALLTVDRVLDRVLGVPGASRLEAEHAFRRLGRERRVAALERRLRHLPDDADDLAVLALDAGWAAIAQRRRGGVQPIAIDSIVGTLDTHKAATFDRAFRPPAFSRGRWTLMYVAARR